jgi:predicted ATP-binding protein involved in virulence
VLWEYVSDVENKLSAFDDMMRRLDLFRSIIHDRFHYKSLHIDRERGYHFTSRDGKPLSPSDLSSGEQHELVLFYELIFNVKPGSYILIDEPELSLHVAWQDAFLQDLQRAAELSQFYAIIATHSPQLISDRWDLAVELTGPSET